MFDSLSNNDSNTVKYYSELLKTIANYQPMTITGIGSVLQMMTVMYLYVSMLQDIGKADPATMQQFRQILNERMKALIQELNKPGQDHYGF
jgi:hypothetical protein